MKLPFALNRNSVLIALGWACLQVPDIDAAASWLKNSNIPHAVWLVHLLAGLSLTLGALALAMPWLRKTLALLGTATPPGAQAPWIPGKPGDPTAAPASPSSEAITKAITPPKP